MKTPRPATTITALIVASVSLALASPANAADMQPLGVGIPVKCVKAPRGLDAWSNPTDTPDEALHATFENQIFVNARLCGALLKLVDYRDHRGWFRRDRTAKMRNAGAPQVGETMLNDHVYDAAVGILSIVHESKHIKLGSVDEGLVECAAIRDVRPTITRLGLPAWLAAQLFSDARTEHASLPSNYRTVC